MDTLESPLSGVAVDVVLLAVVIALHATQRDQNLKLLLVFLIVVHVITTTRCCVGDAESSVAAQHTEAEKVDRRQEIAPQGTSGVAGDKRGKGASDAHFSRQLNSPEQLSKTHDILPATSQAANAKLVDARTRFFKDIV